MNDANPVLELTLPMPQTIVEGSDSVQWKLTTTTSEDGVSVPKMVAVSTETTEESLSLDPDKNRWIMAILVVVINLLVTWVMVTLAVTRQDGMRRLGWAENNKITIEGKERSTYLPVYVSKDDYKELSK